MREILSLNPLKNFEGHLSTPLETRLAIAREWVQLAVAVGTKIIQMPSMFLRESTAGDMDIIVPELQALADLAALSGISRAYEAVAFATYQGLWQDALRIVETVDRPNFGLYFDSFHVHGRIWGDPYFISGVLPNGQRALDESMRQFLEHQGARSSTCNSRAQVDSILY